jgi:hypothetical protein
VALFLFYVVSVCGLGADEAALLAASTASRKSSSMAVSSMVSAPGA